MSRYDVPRAAPEPLRAVQRVREQHRPGARARLAGRLVRRARAGRRARACTPHCVRRSVRSRSPTTGCALDPAAVETMNAAAARLKLRVDDDGRVRFDDGDDPLDRLVAIAFAAMLDGSWGRLKACRNCRWSFYDGSPNRSATWCSMQLCGNRVEDADVPHAPQSRVGSRACGCGRRSAGSPSRPVPVGASRTSARSPAACRPRTASGSPSSGCSRLRSS